MSLNNENNPNEMRIALGVISSDTQFELKRLDKAIKILDVQVLDPTGVAADGTNHVGIQLRRDAVIIAEHSTDSAKEGALVAGVWKRMPEEGLDVDKGANLNLLVDIGGSGALTAGSVAVIRYVEK